MSLPGCCLLIVLSFQSLTSKVGAAGKLHLENSSLDPSLLVNPGVTHVPSESSIQQFAYFSF